MKLVTLSKVMVAVALLVALGQRTFGLVTGMTFIFRGIKALAQMDKSDFDGFSNSYDVFDDPQQNAADEAKVNAVYKVLVPLMELGVLKKFYIPPVMDASKTGFLNLNLQQELFERKMADTLGLGPGKVALDVGCGQGLVADMVQDQSGAKVVGINISPEQIAKARATAESNGKLGSLLDFKVGSMNDRLDFPDNSFDAVYIVQANCYAHNFTALMGEVRRVLKPGGMFSDLAVASLAKYNPDNETQLRMANRAKRVGVITTWRPNKYYEDACTANGFTLQIGKDLGHAEMTQSATDFFTPLGSVMNLAHKVGVIGKKTVESMDRMNEHAKDLIQGNVEELFSINYWIVAQAPL